MTDNLIKFSLIILFNSIQASILKLEYFNCCGYSIRDPIKQEHKQNDFYSIILKQSTRKYFPVTIERGLNTSTLIPEIFRSMKYECFIHLLVSWDKKLVSHLPLSDNNYDASFRRATYMIAFSSKFNIKSVKLRALRELEIRVFLLELSIMPSVSGFFITTIKWRYPCPICNIVWLIRPSERLQNYHQTNYQKHWKEARHNYDTRGHRNRPENDLSCGILILWLTYEVQSAPKRCALKEVIVESIIAASKLNLTVGIGQSGPLINVHFVALEFKETHAQLDFERCLQPQLLYCIHTERQDMPQQNIWYSSVENSVWISICLSIFCVATLHYSKKRILPTKHRSCEHFFNAIFLKLRILLKQNTGHNRTLILLIEFTFFIVLCVYENFLMLNLVIKSPVPAYENFTQLMMNNYTYLTGFSQNEDLWVEKTFGTKNKYATMRLAGNFRWELSIDFFKSLFWSQQDGRKYVLPDLHMTQDVIIQYVNEIVGWKYTCYKMIPVETDFSTRWTFTLFVSSVSHLLQKAKRKLEEMGAYALLESGTALHTSLRRKSIKEQMSISDKDWIAHQKNGGKHQQKYYTITLDNCYVILWVTFVLACLALILLPIENTVKRFRLSEVMRY